MDAVCIFFIYFFYICEQPSYSSRLTQEIHKVLKINPGKNRTNGFGLYVFIYFFFLGDFVVFTVGVPFFEDRRRKSISGIGGLTDVKCC